MSYSERMIPVLIGGPGHDQPDGMIASPLAGPFIAYQWTERADESTGYAFEARYVRRGWRVGDVLVHAYVAPGLEDVEGTELMWRWLLDHAGVPA